MIIDNPKFKFLFTKPEPQPTLIPAMADSRRFWVELFDPATPAAKKVAIEDCLRNHILEKSEQLIKEDSFSPVKLPITFTEGTIIGVVMAGAYLLTPLIYSTLNSQGLSDNFVLIGYSTGYHSTDKIFSDGTSMSGTVFISERDTEVLSRNRNAPLLLMEGVIDTGLTVGTIGSSLVQAGFTDKLFQATLGLDTSDQMWTAEAMRLKPKFEPKPIMNEHGETLVPLKRA